MSSEFSERRVFETEVRERDGRFLEGIAAPYGREAPLGGYVEVLEPGLFAKSIQEAARDLPLLALHDSQKWPIGKSVEWRDREDGLHGVWEFASTAEAKDAYALARDGFATALSVGFSPIRNKIIPGTDTKPTKVHRIEARLAEVSLVSTPAYAEAVVTLVRTAGVKTPTPHRDKWAKWLEARR